jgi:hypothetical protein
MGSGPFAAAVVSERLRLFTDSPGHGMVEPVLTMAVDEYQRALADTADQWSIEPETQVGSMP